MLSNGDDLFTICFNIGMFVDDYSWEDYRGFVE